MLIIFNKCNFVSLHNLIKLFIKFQLTLSVLVPDITGRKQYSFSIDKLVFTDGPYRKG